MFSKVEVKLQFSKILSRSARTKQNSFPPSKERGAKKLFPRSAQLSEARSWLYGNRWQRVGTVFSVSSSSKTASLAVKESARKKFSALRAALKARDYIWDMRYCEHMKGLGIGNRYHSTPEAQSFMAVWQ